ncbi:PAS domain S-box protein [Anditalea andensis]|uniref:histidine kinase n=1 Tax=Anditalea andensis TaxID=1048983 RepID=A0A074KSN8_9BACT|nr:PAS domain S-box protein [Anditalea andensis]KEO71939.1 hypothetical protein EL17_20700 [Anditalea andensis]
MKTLAGDFVNKNFISTSPYSGVTAIKSDLISHSAIVVLDENTNNYLGLLTPLDLILRPHNLVIDCLTEKPMLSYQTPITHALATMFKHHEEVLPIENQNKFEGLVYKNDLIDYLSKQNIKQHKYILQGNDSLKNTKNILYAIYQSTQSIRYLIAPDYSIIFFNKTAEEKTFTYNNKKLKIGDNFTHVFEDLMQKDQHFKNDFYKAIKGKHVVRESRVSDIPKTVWIKSEYLPVFDNNTLIGISLTIHDITERKNREIFIKKQNKILKDLIFFQSHKVRRPIANIMGSLQLIDTSELSEANKEAIDLISKATVEFDSIIKQIVDTAHYWTDNDLSK